MHKIKQQKGFTIIEMLVATSIFSIVSVLTWQGLSTLIQHYKRLSIEINQLQQWELGMAQIKKDLSQMPSLTLVDITTFPLFEGKKQSIHLTTLGEKGQLTHVKYSFTKEGLERKVQYAPWDKKWFHRIILGNISKGQFNYLNDTNNFTFQKNIPKGIDIQFNAQNLGKISISIALKDSDYAG